MFVNDFSQKSYLYITSDQHVRGDKGIDKNVGTSNKVLQEAVVKSSVSAPQHNLISFQLPIHHMQTNHT